MEMKLLNKKTCRRCNELSSIDNFYKCAASKDKRGSYCKNCVRLYCLAFIKEKYKSRNSNISKVDFENSNITKKCHKCKNILKLSFFNIDKLKHDGLSSYCQSCIKETNQRFHLNNPDYAAKYNKQYYVANSEVMKAQSKEYNKINKVLVRKRASLYEKRPWVKVRRRLSFRIKEALLNFNMKKSHRVEKLLGCNIVDFRKYFELKFTKGMIWENFGEWHIDHIKPCASFNLVDIEEQKKCFHYTNLQPLWAEENIKKGSRYKNKTHKYNYGNNNKH